MKSVREQKCTQDEESRRERRTADADSPEVKPHEDGRKQINV